MSKRTRREVLRQFGSAGAGFALGGGFFRGQTSPIRVAGMPVEIAIAPVSPVTVRITVAAIVGTAGVPVDGALVREAEAKVTARRRTADSFAPIEAGNLKVRFTGEPAIHVETKAGQPVQRLVFDAQNPGVSFLLPKGPLLGLGEGGPQFDRKGSVDRMRNGQGGYQLRTHGGRVPIQWLVGTDGWGMFIHHPLGSFDFTGSRRQADAVQRRAAARRLRNSLERSRSDHARVRADHRPRAAAAALVVRLHAVASHAGGTGRGDVGGADVSREDSFRATR